MINISNTNKASMIIVPKFILILSHFSVVLVVNLLHLFKILKSMNLKTIRKDFILCVKNVAFFSSALIAGNGMRMRCDREERGRKEEEAVIRSHFIYPPTKLPSALPATVAEGEGVATAFYIKNAIFEG